MFKSSMILTQINPSFTVKFSIVIENDNPEKFVGNKLVNKFKYGDNEYLKITPKPYIELDVSNKKRKDEGYSPNNVFKFNPKELIVFIRLLASFIKSFKDNKDLYYYDDNHYLYINKPLSDKLVLSMCGTGKRLEMKPVIVPGEKEYEQYEGAILFINTQEHYTYIRYDDLEYLYYLLRQVNMFELSLQMLTVTKLLENEEEKDIPIPPIVREIEEENVNDNKPYVKIEEPDTIPDI